MLFLSACSFYSSTRYTPFGRSGVDSLIAGFYSRFLRHDPLCSGNVRKGRKEKNPILVAAQSSQLKRMADLEKPQEGCASVEDTARKGRKVKEEEGRRQAEEERKRAGVEVACGRSEVQPLDSSQPISSSMPTSLQSNEDGKQRLCV